MHTPQVPSPARPVARAAALTLALGAALAATATAHAETLVGLSGPNSLVRFDSATPGTLATPVAITGLAAGENVLAIDLRPTTGVLYGLTSANSVYSFTAGGAATFVGSLSAPLTSGVVGIDFNPAADLSGATSLRIVSGSGQNYAFNVATGATVVATGVQTGFASVAYANNDLSPATATSLYYIDSAADVLKVAAGNFNGAPAPVPITSVGALGVNFGDVGGFDISASGAAFASNGNSLYSVNLATGAASLIGAFGGNASVSGLTAVTAPIPEPSTYALMLAGLLGLGCMAKRRARV